MDKHGKRLDAKAVELERRRREARVKLATWLATFVTVTVMAS